MSKVTPQVMQCMEVWGGNQAADNSVVMAGMDAWVYCRPYNGGKDSSGDAGGDVYFVSSCATGRITRLLVADVSGHGVAVGELAVSLRSLMRRYVNYLDPQRLAQEINRRFVKLSTAGKFATAVVITFFSPTNHATFCNAGHPPPLLYRAGAGWSYIESRDPRPAGLVNLPLGIEEASEYQGFEVKLNLGDFVLCYTDGLPESRMPNGELIGQDGLLRIVKELKVDEPGRIVPDLLDAIAALHPGNLSGDDITILLFRPNTKGSDVSFVKRVVAPLLLGSAIVGALLLGAGPIPWPDAHPANIGGAFFRPLAKLWRGSRKGRTLASPD